MSTMNLPPVINPQYFDSNGLPLAGGSISTYQAGTSTPQATYTDQGGGTPNTNPIVLDSSGRCSMWLDPSLSYKFIFKDSAGATIKTIDNVVGLLTADAVTTASIQDGAVTSAKLAAGAVNSAALESDSSVDANRPVNTNNIRDGAITTGKIAAGAVTYPKISGLLPPTVQRFTSGSGTYNKTYLFAVSSANATVGATYTVNSVTYTVSKTISSGSLLQMTGPSAPPTSGTLTRASGSGDATIAYTSYAAPLYLRVRMVGAGGGGGGSTDVASNNGGTGGTGGDTTLGSLTAGGGVGGAGTGNQSGAAGGSNTASDTSTIVVVANISGQTGEGSSAGDSGGGIFLAGSQGGSSILGPGGFSSHSNSAGSAASGGYGGGGQGGGSGTNGQGYTGSGGGSGGYVEAIFTAPADTYSYSIGSGGSGGTTGANAYMGGAGAGGVVIIMEHYQ